MAQIRLCSVQYYGKHGIYQFEKEKGRLFETDVLIDLRQTEWAALSDEVKDTLNYEEVARLIQEVMSHSVNLLEGLASELAARIYFLNRFPPVIEQVQVRIKKAHPPLLLYTKWVEFSYTFPQDLRRSLSTLSPSQQQQILKDLSTKWKVDYHQLLQVVHATP
jgi:dihydroneopterin aldolase